MVTTLYHYLHHTPLVFELRQTSLTGLSLSCPSGRGRSAVWRGLRSPSAVWWRQHLLQTQRHGPILGLQVALDASSEQIQGRSYFCNVVTCLSQPCVLVTVNVPAHWSLHQLSQSWFEHTYQIFPIFDFSKNPFLSVKVIVGAFDKKKAFSKHCENIADIR